MIDQISRFTNVRKILEMGIFKGGSVVLYDQLFDPNKIVAIEYQSEPVAALANYIEKHHKSHYVKPFYGVNQGDKELMNSILTSEFPQRDIDLVIDDASHLYEESRSAFNTCFPFLKPGARYIIEDWGWAHWGGEFWQRNRELQGKPALSNLLIELFMLTASRPDLIKDIVITPNMIIVKKGENAVTPQDFDIADHYLLRGKTFGKWL